MKPLACASLLAIAVSSTPSAFALAQRTFVSIAGSDVHTCTTTQSLSIAASELSHNSGSAVEAYGGATVALAGNHVVHNASATFVVNGGTVSTSGTNFSAFNGALGPVGSPVGSF